MTALLPAASSDVVWRQLRPRFWVGRADDRHLGTIERGRRFTVTDVDGDARGGYPTLQAAQAALTGELQIVPAAEATHPVGTPLLMGATAAMVAAVALSITGLTLLR
jgi:hypothetical protein